MKSKSQSASPKSLSRSAHLTKRTEKQWRPCALAFAVVLGMIAGAIQQAQAQTFTVLHAFAGRSDGAAPFGGLIIANGNLFGTTFAGGASAGTVFKMSTSGIETVLHRFNWTDGSGPSSNLIQDSAGNLYGTTIYGGAYGYGTVFKLDRTGTEAVMYSFTGQADGKYPPAELIKDSSGNFYSTTTYGGDLTCGAPYGCGTVFKLDASGNETVLHRFAGGSDGAYPYLSGLVMDSGGNMYGTTSEGGASNDGTVFKVDTNGVETVLNNFTGGQDGRYPVAGLIRDKNGNLYGTTLRGGDLTCSCGTVFKINTSGNETVLYRFTGGTDGSGPQGGLIMSSAGSLYGTTYQGGATGAGTVFKVSGQGKEIVLHSFNGPTEGAYPYARLVRDAKGNLYGTATQGGSGTKGTVFKLTP